MRSLHLSAALILGTSVFVLALPAQDSLPVEARSLEEAVLPRDNHGTGKPNGDTGIGHSDGPGKPGDNTGVGKPGENSGVGKPDDNTGIGKPGHETRKGNPTPPGKPHGKETRSHDNDGVGHSGGHGKASGKGWNGGHGGHGKPGQKPGGPQHESGKGP